MYVTPVQTPLGIIERRIDALGVAWLVYAGLILLFGAMGLTVARGFLDGHSGPWGGWSGHPWHGPAFPLFFLRLGWYAILGKTALAALAGWGLMQKYNWARWVAIVAAIVSVLHPPFGTAIAIWTFLVLLSGVNAAGYQAMAR
jgi:hypothetical protein